MKQILVGLATGALISMLSACAGTGNPTINTSGEPSFDGLIPLTGTRMKQVWVKPDLNLKEYTKFIPVGAGLQFRPVKSVSTMRSSSRREFPLTPEQQAKVREVVSEEFNKALDRVTTLQRVDKPGPDVLLVRGAIIDIVSRVPPQSPGRSDVYLDSVGQATFVIELIDSETSTVLARATDTRAAETPGYTRKANRVTNTAEVRKLASYWASLLVDALNTITTLPSLNDDAK